MKQWPIWKDKLDSPNTEGGLRTKGVFKTSEIGAPLISYVTIVRNNPQTIERTIQSVQKQSYKNIEHIILDGASTDNTLEIIKRYSENIDYFASESDNGLYNALNKAIELCRGEFILVLNSDDWLSDDSAEYIAKNYTQGEAIFVAGTAKVLVDKFNTVDWHPQQVTKNSYLKVANLNHNAVYASRKTYELSGSYDDSYKIAADTKWVLKCYDIGAKFYYTNEILVNYSLGGTSSDIYWHVEECKRIIKEKFPFLKGDEVQSLNYIYYQWKEGFKFPLVGFNAYLELSEIAKKYTQKKDFIEALNLEETIHSLSMENSSVASHSSYRNQSRIFLNAKKIVSIHPLTYNLAKKIYKKLRRN